MAERQLSHVWASLERGQTAVGTHRRAGLPALPCASGFRRIVVSPPKARLSLTATQQTSVHVLDVGFDGPFRRGLAGLCRALVAQLPSACGVGEICNLMYRRFPICQRLDYSARCGSFDRLPTAHRRYSRLGSRATRHRLSLAAWPSCLEKFYQPTILLSQLGFTRSLGSIVRALCGRNGFAEPAKFGVSRG